MKNKPPAFQLYVNDFLSGTSHMSNEEVGCYIRLLCHSWDRDGLPDDEAILDRLAGRPFGRAKGYTEKPFFEEYALVMEKFAADESGILRNSRLEEYRNHVVTLRAKRAEYAKKGGESTKNKWAKKVNGKEAKRPSKRLSEKGPKGGPLHTSNSINNSGVNESDIRLVLDKMNEVLESKGFKSPTYKLTDSRRTLIAAVIEEYKDLPGILQAVARTTEKWADTKYQTGLNPDNFFKLEKFNPHYEQREFMGHKDDSNRKEANRRIEELSSKFLNPETGDFSSEHRYGDGSLKPEARAELNKLKAQITA